MSSDGEFWAIAHPRRKGYLSQVNLRHCSPSRMFRFATRNGSFQLYTSRNGACSSIDALAREVFSEENMEWLFICGGATVPQLFDTVHQLFEFIDSLYPVRIQ